MQTFAASLLVLATLTCASVIPSKPNVKATYRWEKSNNAHLLSLHDSNGGHLGAACAPSLNATALGGAPVSYNFDAEKPWEGTISVAGKEYQMLWDEDTSDPNCAMAYNADFVEVQCHFFAETTSDIQSGESQLLDECTGSGLSLEMSRIAKGRSVVNTNEAQPAVQSNSSSLVARDYPAKPDTILVDKGNPHQNGWNYQCTDTLTCDQQNSCSAGVSNADAFMWSFMASVTPFVWITGGFNVGKSYTTTQIQTCNAMASQSVCVWHIEVYTSYTVQNANYRCVPTNNPPCSDFPDGDPFVLNSPNAIQQGSHYYCVINTCRQKADGYYQYGPAGPPPT